MLIADFDGSKLTKVTEIIIPDHRGMTDIEGTLDDLLTSRAWDDVQGHFIRAKLTDTTTQVHAMDQLRSRFPHILRLELPTISTGPVDWDKIDKESPIDVCCSFVEFVRGNEATPWEREQFDGAIVATSAMATKDN